jgi:hypothetical protein
MIITSNYSQMNICVHKLKLYNLVIHLHTKFHTFITSNLVKYLYGYYLYISDFKVTIRFKFSSGSFISFCPYKNVKIKIRKYT